MLLQREQARFVKGFLASSTYRTVKEALSICHSKGLALWNEKCTGHFPTANQSVNTRCEGYIDNIVIYNKTWQQHLECIRSLFNRLTQANLTVNSTKSEFGHAHISFLWHVVGQREITPVMAKEGRGHNKLPSPRVRERLCVFWVWLDTIESSVEISLL